MKYRVFYQHFKNFVSTMKIKFKKILTCYEGIQWNSAKLKKNITKRDLLQNFDFSFPHNWEFHESIGKRSLEVKLFRLQCSRNENQKQKKINRGKAKYPFILFVYFYAWSVFTVCLKLYLSNSAFGELRTMVHTHTHTCLLRV